MPRRLALRSFVAASALGVASPAAADMTAEYVGATEHERTVIEIAENGDLRITTGTGEADGYLLVVSGKAYSVDAGPGGPLVTASEVQAYVTQRAIDAGSLSIVSIDAEDQTAFLRFVPGDPIELAGYRGTEYAPEQGSHTPVGIADDEALAPLGRAYLRYRRAIDEMDVDARIPDNLGELLEGRGVIRFWGGDLRRVSFDPIDPARFVLPAEPLLLEQVLEEEPAEARKTKDDDFDPIVRAVYSGQALWTLTRDGELVRWAEGAATGTAIDAPGSAVSLCGMGDALLLVTGNRQGTGIVKFWSRSADDWKQETSFRQSREDPFLALDCSGNEPLLLTATALRLPRSKRTIAIDPEKLAPGGYFTTLQHGGYLYVGSNAGEWGGGLRRFSLTAGAGETLDASDPQELCGGALNMDCDPVTGLAPDPARPECVLASVGLVHFFSSGQVARICEGQITVAYRKPYTLDPDWETNPLAQESFSSVPFYSMASDEGAAWAVANDGLYRFGAEERPAFIPFGRTRRLPPSGIDWSDPRFVLVATDMNQHHSLGGTSLLLVAR
jgi:hypothetical protein